ncbi:TetR/AcrR family transcriptional regulator [Segniliparus rugosus]|uniref:HTH tetR-type domain-containing protein n=1 Tax=Segniliparus rugosus (strain ATCC BAA-974 / DSM 45345 / CCUG 50838 / CIP 108380 / JCM 13579 / CDC 945) TaxID=679197 RepID=E5XRB5_SEGRC|nr:TetR/AcrR family transcriptional regulator [Segniliparus rugosus]EFV13118.2 hypothetical protein HMPREF9336_02037 [Segniliparus rugosus ATCC BAA-974]
MGQTAGGNAGVTAEANPASSNGEGLRQRKARLTWEAINRAARQLALERSLDDISVQEIAERANVSARTVFNYFPSKEDAVLGFREIALPPSAVRRFLDSSNCLFSDTAVLAFEALRENWADFATANVLGELLEKNPKLGRRLGKAAEQFDDKIKEVVLQRADDSFQAAVVTAIAGRLCGLCVEMWVRGGSVVGQRQILEEALEALHRSL